MLNRSSNLAASLALAGVFLLQTALAQAADQTRYPNWKGQWDRFVVRGLPGQPSHDQTKPWGPGQQAPLTEEYRKIHEASMADLAKGGIGNFPTVAGRAAGMPYMMMAFGPLEFVVTPDTTYIMIGWHDHYRRIFTDGRDWPKEIVPTYSGYSIGRWTDPDAEGRYRVLEFETRGFKGPRAYDETGLPLHVDNQSIFKERMFLDPANPKIIHDEMTTIDHGLTRPWTVDKRYVLNPDPQPEWLEFYITENNPHVMIAGEHYYLSADGLLMPAKKDQPPPDLRYFKPATR